MLKNLASLGTAGAVQNGASRILLDMRPRTTSCPKSLLRTLPNAPFPLRTAPLDINKYGIDNRRHCMGPSVDLFEPESHIRRLRFTGKCARLTTEKNISSPGIPQSSHLEIRSSRPASCPQKLSHATSMKQPSGSSEKLYSKDTLVSSLLKSKLSCGYTNTATSKPSSSEVRTIFSPTGSSRPSSSIAERGSLNRFSFQNILKPSRPSSNIAERGSLNRFSIQNILKPKRPITSTPRLLKINQSSSYLRKPSKINQDNRKSVEKGLSWYFGSGRRVFSFDKKAGKISKIPNMADKGKVSLSMNRPQNIVSRNFPKPISGQTKIRTSCNSISSGLRSQKSSASVVVPCWQVTNSSNAAKTNRLARSSRSVTGVSSCLLSNKSPEKSLSKLNRPVETNSSPSVFDDKTIPSHKPMNKVGENTEKSEVITLLEPQSTFRGWRGNTKTQIQKLPFKKPKPEEDLELSNIDSQVARRHSSPKPAFTRTETNKLHPGTMNANKQIAMIYKDKFDPALLDRFRFRNVTANQYSKPSNYKTVTAQSSSAPRSTTYGDARTTPVARKPSFTSSAVAKALEIKNNLNFVKKAPPLPAGRRESFAVRPVMTARQSQATSGWVPFIRPPLMTTKPRAEKSFEKTDSKQSIDKSGSFPSKRPLRQWKEKAEKWTDSVSRRPELETKGRFDKLTTTLFKQKPSKKLEEPNASNTDNRGSNIGSGKDGRKKIPLTVKKSTSLRNIGARKLQVSMKTSRHRPGYYRW